MTVNEKLTIQVEILARKPLQDRHAFNRPAAIIERGRTHPAQIARITESRRERMPTIKSTSNLSEGRVGALLDFRVIGLHRDLNLRDLYLRIGPKKASYYFLSERRVRGERVITSRLLGHAPSMPVLAARAAAAVIAGQVAEGNSPVGKRRAVKFGEALDTYLAHLKREASDAGKPARHAYNVESLARLYLRPRFGQWSLADMSADPKAVRDFHRDVTERAGPVSANAAVKIIRAAYGFEARANRSLRLDALPTSATVMNLERPRQVSIEDWPAWAVAWRSIRSPVRRAFHLLQLLTGARGGELSKLKWADVDCRGRAITLRNAKAGADIVLPMSGPIAMALKLAREAGPGGEFVFPGSGKSGHIAKGDDGLPVAGHALRHTWRGVAHECGIDELSAHLLLGHAPAGVSARYLHTLALSLGPGLRKAQRAVSRRIMGPLMLDRL
jgi:integrase